MIEAVLLAAADGGSRKTWRILLPTFRFGSNIDSSEPVITDPRSALELTMRIKYETGSTCMAIDKRAVCEDFFILSTGLAGEILQKLVNYQIRAAIYGDYSRYTSKPLKDFIYESNHGGNFFFVPTKEEAVRRLTESP